MQKIHELLQREMTRKEFLATLGFGVASIFGLSSLLKMLGKESPLQNNKSMGYGGGAYGGSRKQ